MTDDNEVIRQWLGECQGGRVIDGVCQSCRRFVNKKYCADHVSDYTNPSAWTPKLFQKIEDAGLWSKFMHHFCIPLTGFDWDGCHMHDYFFSITKDIMQATPEQKASALSKAIKEAGQ